MEIADSALRRGNAAVVMTTRLNRGDYIQTSIFIYLHILSLYLRIIESRLFHIRIPRTRTLPQIMRPTLTFLAFLPLIAAFDCSITASSISYDLSPLTGLRTASKDSSTPPTTSEAKVSMNLCAAEGLGKEDGVADEDQVGGMSMGNWNILMIE